MLTSCGNVDNSIVTPQQPQQPQQPQPNKYFTLWNPCEALTALQDYVKDVTNGKKLPDHFDMKHAYAAAKAYSGMTLAEFDAYVKAYAQE